ncbi:branched-chain amino acid ABC transporter permease [Ferviditalea candida]|uniref:Branched-chain amino acid ABC transporter permease n=1 Tax=Ferviditalea candida TaxID=3108399 RepID=A0ABU5ZLE3_9BACL|nr:branched-chain amino acid ABC transporter permease [Paenibacillaceae bacterium T2]
MSIKRILIHPLFLFAVALYILPYFMVYTGSFVDLASSIIIYGLLAMGFNFLFGHTGDLSFGHGLFFTFAGFTAGNIALHFSSNLFLTLILGVLSSVVIGAIVGGLAVYRSKGIYFSMITLAFGQVFFYIGYSSRGFTGGENGLGGIPKPNILGLNLSDPPTFYYTAAVFVFIGAYVLYRIANSPFGKVCRAINANKNRPEFLGYDVKKYRFKAFLVSSAIAGYAGVLSVYHIGYMSSQSSHWSASGEIVMMSVLGGINNLFGPVIGALMFKYLEDILSGYTNYWFLPVGIIFVFFVLVAPKGIAGLLQPLYEKLAQKLGINVNALPEKDPQGTADIEPHKKEVSA